MAYTMKYQGNPSAFPFKSPVKKTTKEEPKLDVEEEVTKQEENPTDTDDVGSFWAEDKDGITEHVLFKDPAISSVEHSEITYSPESGLQISGPGSKTGDILTNPDGTTYKNIWKDSGKLRSAKWILENPDG